MPIEVTSESLIISSPDHKSARQFFSWFLIASATLAVTALVFNWHQIIYQIGMVGGMISAFELFFTGSLFPKRTLTFRRSRPILIIQTSRPFKKTKEQINLNRSVLKLTKHDHSPQYTLTLEGDHDPINLFSWQSPSDESPNQFHPDLNLLLENLPYLTNPVLTESPNPHNTPAL